VKFETYLLLGILVFGIFRTRRSVRRSQSEEERFFAIRMSAFTWVVGILLLMAFVFLPNKPRILLLLPALVVVLSLVSFWKTGRSRIRQAREDRVNLDRMKRVN
jgi:Na+/H+ antiporter NhaD/arsenite permease-like protein